VVEVFAACVGEEERCAQGFSSGTGSDKKEQCQWRWREGASSGRRILAVRCT